MNNVKGKILMVLYVLLYVMFVMFGMLGKKYIIYFLLIEVGLMFIKLLFKFI